jgi:hypothetical protein
MRNEIEFLTDVLARLNRTSINYMLTGSMASNYWGIPRTTHDLDFVLLLTIDDVDRFNAAFKSGMFLQEDSVRAAFAPPYQFNVLDEQSALKADFWLLRNDPFEQSVFARRLQVNLFETDAWIATAEDVLLHKLFWNRITPSDRQLQDAAGIVAVQADKLDRAYLLRWAAPLRVAKELAELLAGKIGPKST